MDDDREMRAKFCSALRLLEQDIPEEDLNDAVRAVLAGTPVRQAVAGLGIPSYVFEEAGPCAGTNPGAWSSGRGRAPRESGTAAPTGRAVSTWSERRAASSPPVGAAGCVSGRCASSRHEPVAPALDSLSQKLAE